MFITPASSPLTSAQQGIWVAQQLLGSSDPVYNVAEYITIQGDVCLSSLLDAIRTCLYEADSLHMRVDKEGNQRLVSDRSDFRIPVIDYRHVDIPEKASLQWMTADLATSIDLVNGPAFTTAVFRCSGATLWYLRTHHLCADGYAFAQIAEKVAMCYRSRGAGVKGRPFGRLQEVMSYDLEYQNSPRCKTDGKFWRNYLADLSNPLSYFDTDAGIQLPKGLQGYGPSTELLDEASNKLAVSWVSLVVAAVAAHVHARTGYSDVIIGLPMANRAGVPAARVPCTSMNIVPLRLSIAPGTSLGDLAVLVEFEINRVRPYATYRHEWMSRDAIQDAAPRQIYGPVVNFLPFKPNLDFGHGHTARTRLAAGPISDLTLTTEIVGGCLKVGIEVPEDISSRVDLPEIWNEIQSILHDIVKDSSQVVRPAVEVETLIEGESNFAPWRDVIDLFLRAVNAMPDALAVDGISRSFTYKELHMATLGIKSRLLDVGVVPGARVAVLLPRGEKSIISMLAILFCGATYIPLDPHNFNNSQLAEICPQLVIVNAQEQHLISECSKFLFPDINSLHCTSNLSDVNRVDFPKNTSAYMLFTSGSTGRPKGVLVDRHAIGHFIVSASAVYGLKPQDRVLHFASPQFDTSIEEVLISLCTGATVVPRSDNMSDTITGFLKRCADLKITVLDLPTSFWHEIAVTLFDGTVTFPSSIHTVIIGGEPVMKNRLTLWNRMIDSSQVRLVNTYGPTETTIVASAGVLTDDEPHIGRPLPGVTMAISSGGELLIGGPTLSSGYINRSALNAERFVKVADERMFRTGDLGEVTSQGFIRYQGRRDRQLKLSGHRVDLDGVESLLSYHPSVHEAALIAVPTDAGSNRLVAFVVLKNSDADSQNLKSFLSQKIPEYSRPGRIITIDRLPRTISGKIDRSVLSNLCDGYAAKHTLPACSDDLVKAVLSAWTEVLGTPPDGLNSGFVESGGSSFQAIQLATRLEAKLYAEVPMSLIFNNNTIQALVEALRDHLVLDSNDSFGVFDESFELDAQIHLPQLNYQVTVPPQRVLVTGATGFVGAHVVSALLKRGVEVSCLVRAKDDAAASLRVTETLVKYRLAHQKIRAFAADIGEPNMGLESGLWNTCAEDFDTIFHVAADVNATRGYSVLYKTNIEGTKNVFRLAAEGCSTTVHMLSSFSLLPEGDAIEQFISGHSGLKDGYQQSKWVAERIAQQVSDQGLRVGVHRVGRVVASGGTGEMNQSDIMWKMVKAGLAVGALPDLNYVESWLPVDLLADALVAIAYSPEVGVFHHYGTNPIMMADIAAWVNARGADTRLVSLAEWKTLVKNPVTCMLADVLESVGAKRRISYERTRHILGFRDSQFPSAEEIAFAHIDALRSE